MGPGHQGDRIQGDGSFGILRRLRLPKQGTLAKEIICGENFYYRLRAIIQGDRDLDPPLDDQMQPGRGLVFIEDDLPLPVISYTLSRKITSEHLHFPGKNSVLLHSACFRSNDVSVAPW
jgi:hypothetical protein